MSNRGDFSVNQSSVISMLPRFMLLFLIGVYLVAAQWNPCDSTSVAAGDSLNLIVIGIAIGVLTPISGLLQRKRATIPMLPAIGLVLFAVWLSISIYMVSDNTNLRVALLGLWQAIAILGVLHGLVTAFSCSQVHNKVLHCSIALAIGSSLYALYQYFVSMPQTRSQFLLSKAEMLQQVGITPGSAEAMQFENRLFSFEPIGPFALTNSLAGVLAPVVVLVGIVVWGMIWRMRASPISSGQSPSDKAMYLVGENDLDGASKKYITLVSIAVFAITSFVLVLTKSRTAWIATAVGIFLGGLLLIRLLSRISSRGIYLGLAASLGVGFLGVFAIYWIDSAILTEAGKSLLYRIEYWQGAWQLSLNSPWFGYGPLAFQSEYVTVKALTASESPADPHNMWMEILVWGGYPLLGLTSLVALWFASSIIRFWHSLGRGELESSQSNEFAKGCQPPVTSVRLEINSTGSTAMEIGAGVTLLAILFFGLIVYSVDPKSDLLFNSLAFCGGTVACYWLIRKVNFTSLGMWMASVLIVVVVSIHFLFSGGWMQPGAMSPLVIGLAGMLRQGTKSALGVQEKVSFSVSTADQTASRTLAIQLVGWLGVALAFGLMTMGPERERSTIEQLHRELQLSRLPMEDYPRILEANRRDPDQASWLMQAAHQQLMDSRLGPSTRRQWVDAYQQARKAWISRDPRNWVVHNQLAIMDSMLLEVGRALGIEGQGREDTERILANARQAAGLNPTSAQCQLQLAVLTFWSGSVTEAKNALAAAERIDRATPHSDRKIAACSVWVPRELTQSKDANSHGVVEVGASGYFKGEPVFSWLRKAIQ